MPIIHGAAVLGGALLFIYLLVLLAGITAAALFLTGKITRRTLMWGSLLFNLAIVFVPSFIFAFSAGGASHSWESIVSTLTVAAVLGMFSVPIYAVAVLLVMGVSWIVIKLFYC